MPCAPLAVSQIHRLLVRRSSHARCERGEVGVVDAAGALSGIISIGDVVKHRLGELEEEAGAMREYISGSR